MGDTEIKWHDLAQTNRWHVGTTIVIRSCEMMTRLAMETGDNARRGSRLFAGN
jgi:hypothetical protein